MRTWARRPIPWLAGSVVAALVAAVVALVVHPGAPTRTVVAHFSEAPGLYPGNHVEVLGIPVGTVSSVRPGPGFVTVTMRVRASLPIPADAAAAIMAPQVVADRFVELTPAYGGGPKMAPGAVIPLSRTVIPQSVDAVVAALNSLAAQLGPNGANKNGALTDLVHRLALQLGPNGSDLHDTVVNFSQALDAVAQSSPAVAGTLNNLGSLAKSLGDDSATYRAFTANLAAVSQVLANDRSDVATVLSSLQQLFANLTSFLRDNASNLGSSIDNLDKFAAALASQQSALAEAFDLAPLSAENLNATIDLKAPGGPALRGRYDPVAATEQLFSTVCGSVALRFLVVLATGTQTNPLTVATPQDTICGVGNALNALTPPPGSTPGPDLSLRALVP